jgi:acetyltransferase
MGLFNLDKLFDPESVAVIGASDKPESIGHLLVKNLLEADFPGTVVPVNPAHSSILSLPCKSSVGEADTPVNLAVVATPIATVPDIVGECIEAGIEACVILSAGGKETGSKGRKIEDRILERARQSGLRVLGPNCLGFICPHRRLNASFAHRFPQPGNLAFVSQSGAICTAMLDLAARENFGFSHFVSVGSMLDVDFGDMVDYLGSASKVGSILLYMESLTQARKFMSAARAVARVKPVVVLKAGRSEAGAAAASSHTGAMAGTDAVYDAAFERAGLVRVDTIGELFDCAELLAKQPRPRGRRMAVITNAGGAGVMAADALAARGLEHADLKDDTLKKLDRELPAAWSRSNPVDLLGDASPDRFAAALKICLAADEFDAVMVIFDPVALTPSSAVAEAIVAAVDRKPHSLFACWMGGADVEAGRKVLNEAGIPTYDTPETAILAFAHIAAYATRLELLNEIPPRLPDSLQFDKDTAGDLIRRHLGTENERFLNETASKQLLGAYGIAVNPTEAAKSAAEAERVAAGLQYPVVMKILSPDITHKSDAGGVKLNLRDGYAIHVAFEEIMQNARKFDPGAEIRGVTLQPMAPRPDFEMLIGARRDPTFGPVVLFGTGGIFAEIFRDRSIGLPPLNRLLSRRIMQSTRIFRLLQGYRNRPGADLGALEKMLIQLAQLLVDFPQIRELDMNPVVVVDGRPLALDARVRLEAADVDPPHHLVISPYPSEYEFAETTAKGLPIFIRPIKPEDAPLFVALFETLSESSIYYRFFQNLRTLPRRMLVRFTQVDYDRHIVLTAIDHRDDHHEMLGVARIIGDPDGRTGEFAILVGDPWQGRGVGAAILDHCLQIARERGMRRVWALVLPENTSMLKLGQRLGFERKFDRENSAYRLKMDLDP